MSCLKKGVILLLGEGEVVDKNGGSVGVPLGDSSVITSQYSIKVKKTDGKTTSLSVSQGVYEQFKIGDKIVKEPGEHNPTKL